MAREQTREEWGITKHSDNLITIRQSFKENDSFRVYHNLRRYTNASIKFLNLLNVLYYTARKEDDAFVLRYNCHY